MSYSEFVKKSSQAPIGTDTMLDDNIESVIRDVSQYVTDSVWIGKANFLLRRLKINGNDDSLTMRKAHALIAGQSDDRILSLYNKYSRNKSIKWKDSIKQVIGIKAPATCGLDL